MAFLVRSPLKRWVIVSGVFVVVALVLMFAPRPAAASVTLNYFRVQWKADLATVAITWQTATELNVVGFIVQRSTSPTTGFVDITAVIPAVGDQLTGGTYGPVADNPLDLTPGVIYWYRLMVINTAPPNDVYAPFAMMAGGWRPIYLPVLAR
jgi:hypothetical protein